MERVRYYIVGKIKFIPDITESSNIGVLGTDLVHIIKRLSNGEFSVLKGECSFISSDVQPIIIWVDRRKVNKKRDIEWLIKANIQEGQKINYRVRSNMITLQGERNSPESKNLVRNGFINLHLPPGYNFALGYSETVINDSE